MKDKAKILIIEDEQDIREIYELVLKDAGYSVHMAENGLEGIEKLKSCEVDLVLLDLMMPVMGGIETLKYIKAHFNQELPVIIMTNIGTVDLPQNLLGSRTEVVIKVELEPSELLEKVENLLNS